MNLLDKITEAAAEVEATQQNLRAAVAEAVANGVPVAAAAGAAGVTRPTAYAWIKAQKENTMTIAQFAAEHSCQPYEVAAFLDLGRDWADDMELDPELEAVLAETWVDEDEEA